MQIQNFQIFFSSKVEDLPHVLWVEQLSSSIA